LERFDSSSQSHQSSERPPEYAYPASYWISTV
jgi:hypothetical protein